MKNFTQSLIEKAQDPESQARARFGEYLRKKRMANNLTLEAASIGICSPSQLSKLETNSLNADSYSMRFLAEKANLDVVVEGETVQVNDRIFPAIRAFYAMDNDTLITLRDEIDDPMLDTSKQLIDAFIDVLSGKIERVRDVCDELLMRYLTLPLNDHLALSLLIVINSYQRKDYRAALMLTRMMDSLNIVFPEYNFLMNYYGYLTAEQVERPHISDRFYKRAEGISTTLFSAHYLPALSLQRLYFLNREDPLYVYEQCMKPSGFQVPEHLINTKTLICLKNALKMNHPCPALTVNEAVKDDAYYQIKVIQAKTFKQFDDAAFESVNQYQQIYKKLYELNKIDDAKARSNFIRAAILPELKRLYMPEYARAIYEELAEFQRSINRYKEADSVSKQLAKYLKKMKTS